MIGVLLRLFCVIVVTVVIVGGGYLAYVALPVYLPILQAPQPAIQGAAYAEKDGPKPGSPACSPEALRQAAMNSGANKEKTAARIRSCFGFPSDTATTPRDDNTLHYAAYKGDVERIVELMARGASIATPLPPSGRTPLYYAALGRKTPAFVYLLEIGAGLGTPGKRGADYSIPLLVNENDMPQMFEAMIASTQFKRLSSLDDGEDWSRGYDFWYQVAARDVQSGGRRNFLDIAMKHEAISPGYAFRLVRRSRPLRSDQALFSKLYFYVLSYPFRG